MIGALDRYVFRAVAAAWGAALLFLLFISVLVDLLNGLGRYVEQAERQDLGFVGLLWHLALLYLQLVPSFFVMVAPFVTVIAAIFAVGKLLAAHELHPMLFAGRSMARVLRPLIAVGLLSGLGMAACWEWLLPSLDASLARTRSALQGEEPELKSVVLEPKAGTVRRLYVQRYLPEQQRMEGVNLLVEGSGPGDSALVQAQAAAWDAAAGDWRLEAGRITRELREEPRDWLGEPGFPPDVVAQAGKENVETELQSYTDLLELRRLRPQRDDVTLALHRHVTYPLANVVLLLLALPFTIHFERRHRIERLLAAILVCGAYLTFDLTCQSLGLRDWLHPIVAAWAPTILFGSLGMVLFGALRT